LSSISSSFLKIIFRDETAAPLNKIFFREKRREMLFMSGMSIAVFQADTNYRHALIFVKCPLGSLDDWLSGRVTRA
jgi:hypothetical protein